MTSILLIEDHPLFVQSLTRLLRDRGKYDVITAPSAEQAMEQLSNSTVDLALIDVSLPGKNGIDLISDIHQQKPGLPCLMVSGHMAPTYVRQSLDAGARGYVLKEDINGILEAIRQVLRGGTYVSRALRAT